MVFAHSSGHHCRRILSVVLAREPALRDMMFRCSGSPSSGDGAAEDSESELSHTFPSSSACHDTNPRMDVLRHMDEYRYFQSY